MSWSTIRVPVAPPASPVAITGAPSVLSTRATLTPLPPGIVVCSTVRWRRPSRKLGTDSVLSMAVLSVTVTIMRRVPPATPPRGGGAAACEQDRSAQARRSRRATGPTGARPPTSSSARSPPRAPSRSAISGTVATTFPPCLTSTRPSCWPRWIGPSTTSGAWTAVVTASRCPRRTIRRTVRAGTSVELGTGAVADLRRRHRPALDDGADPLEARECPREQVHRVAVAGRLAGRPEHGADELDPVAARRADEHVAGAAGVAGLDAVDAVVAEHEPVAVAERARPDAGLERPGRGVHDLAEEPVLAQQRGQRHEVARGRVVALLVEPDRVRVVRVLEVELARAPVHLRARTPCASRRRPRRA